MYIKRKGWDVTDYLQSKWMEFDDFNVETKIEAEAKVRGLYEGKLKFPTIIVGNDYIKNPTISQLEEFLECAASPNNL